MLGRRLVVSLLLLAALSATVVLPSGLSQTLTTLVETFTTRTVVTSTVNSTVGKTQALSTQAQFYTYSTPFVIDATKGTYACTYKALRFAANKGDQISGQIRSNIEISFYVMSAEDYRTWASGNSCTVPSSLFGQQKVTTLLLDMVAPSTGDYDVLVLNTSPNTAANVSVIFVAVSQSITTISLPVVSAFLAIKTYNTTGAQTIVRAVETGLLLEQYGLLIGVGLVIVLVVFVLQRRSRKKGLVAPSPTEPAPLQVRRKFCGNCGTTLPMDAQFCDQCGSYDDGS